MCCDEAQASVRQGKAWIEGHGAQEQLVRFLPALSGVPATEVTCLEEEVVGFGVVCRRACGAPLGHRGLNLRWKNRPEGGRGARGDLVLQREEIVRPLIDLARPKRPRGAGLDEPSAHT
jgi:hypothetical protein